MDLYLWPPRWNLGSFDPESLCILTYVKFGGLPVNLRTKFSILQAPDGVVPYLHHGTNIRYGLRQIFEYLRKENYGIEYDFEEADLVKLNALMKTVEIELLPAILHIWFINIDSYSHTTRQAYGESAGFPHSLYIGRWLRHQAHKRVYDGHMYPSPTLPMEDIDKIIMAQAKVCITSLAYLLGQQMYFLGDKPSAIDAVVFGLLYPLLRSPIPNHPLVEHITQCENITKYCQRIQKQFYADLSSPYVQSPKTAQTNVSNVSDMESVFSFIGLRNIALFALGALVINFGYAYASNMIEVDLEEDEDEEEDDEDEDENTEAAKG